MIALIYIMKVVIQSSKPSQIYYDGLNCHIMVSGIYYKAIQNQCMATLRLIHSLPFLSRFHYPVFGAYPDNICPLQIRLVAQGTEDRGFFIEKIQYCVEFSNLASIHYDNAVIVS